MFAPRLVGFKRLEDANKFRDLVVKKYLARPGVMGLTIQTVDLGADLEVGCTVDTSGRDKSEGINIWWMDVEKKPVDLKKLRIYRTERGGFSVKGQVGVAQR
jgi:hypothetical protein